MSEVISPQQSDVDPSMSTDQIQRIMAAVDARFEEQIEFLQRLVEAPSLRGNEKEAQNIVSGALHDRGYDVSTFPIDAERIGRDPAFSPTAFDLGDSPVVVGIQRPAKLGGRSLALNAHIDVVPVGTESRWKHPPFKATRDGDWLYGRGAGDMKAGLVANLFAIDAIKAAGLDLKGEIQFQSVIEEEITGNGAAMVLAEGYRADAVLIPEPTGEQVVSANTGVIKFVITVHGVPAHPFEVAAGTSAIDIAIRAIEHLQKLEQDWIADRVSQPGFADVDNPIALTIGTINGGEWIASVPSECSFEGRIGFYPGEAASSRVEAFEQYLHDAFSTDPLLAGGPKPEIVWSGVHQGGYVLPEGTDAEHVLANAHRISSDGSELQRFIMPCYLDSAVFGLHGDMTSLVYGPISENIHAIDERVSLSSLKRVTKSIALFAAEWCGVEERT